MDVELGRPERALTRPQRPSERAADGEQYARVDSVQARSLSYHDSRNVRYLSAYFESVLRVASLVHFRITNRQQRDLLQISLPFRNASTTGCSTPPPPQRTAGETHKAYHEQICDQNDVSPQPAIIKASYPRQRKTLGTTKLSRPVKTLNSDERAHNRYAKRIFGLLGSVVEDEHAEFSFVFVCWGHHDRCKILAVRVPNTADEVEFWCMINEAWYRARGRWRRYIPMLGARRLSCVQIAIAGPVETKVSNPLNSFGFEGIYTPMAIAEEKAQYEATIRRYVPSEYPCTYNPSTGKMHHESECINFGDLPGHECRVLSFYHAQRQLLRFKMQRFLKLAFLNPWLFAGNDLLKDNSLIYGHQDLLREINAWHCPRLGELALNALHVDTTRDFRNHILPLCLCLLLIMVPLARVSFGDWGTAWSTGSFFVGFAALLLKWNEER